MKKPIFLLSFLFCLVNVSHAYVVNNPTVANAQDEELASVVDGLENFSMEDVLNMTPKKYKELTGKKMGFKNAMKLKFAKKKLKKHMTKPNAAIGKGLYIFLAIIGWGFLGMGLNDDWEGKDWIICLVLGLFTCLGGLIYALIKKSKYY